MREFSYKGSPEAIKEAFSFLKTDLGFEIIEENLSNYGPHFIYSKDDFRLSLIYDYKENFFYFDMIKGKDTLYPNDNDVNNIRPLFRFFEKHGVSMGDLQPDNYQYQKSLKLNAELLRKYQLEIFSKDTW